MTKSGCVLMCLVYLTHVMNSFVEMQSMKV